MRVKLLAAVAVLTAVTLLPVCSGTPEPPSQDGETPGALSSATPEAAVETPVVTAEPVVSVTAEPSATPTAETATATASDGVTAQPTPDIGPEPVRGGTIRLAAREAFDHQDVHDDASPALSTWGPGLVYSRMFRLKTGPDVPLPSLVVECDLCASWRMTDDLTFEFDLRPGVLWQDATPVNGRPLTSGDVLFSYERQREAGRPNASLLRSIESIETLGDGTLRVRLKVADADFLIALADARSKIVAPEAIAQADGLRNGPTVGTGPWRLSSLGNDGSSTYVRNDLYYEPSLPYADGLRIQVIPDAGNRLAGFVTNILDFHESNPAEWARLSTRRPDAPFVRVPQPGVGLELTFNASAPPFDDASIRRAAFLAMDPWRAVADVWKGQAFVSLGSPVVEERWLLNREQLQPFFAQPEEAAAALREVRVAPFTLTVGDFGAEYLAHAEMVLEELKSVGFDAEMRIVNRRVFGDEVWASGDYQMYAGPLAPVTMPNSYLLWVLHSRGLVSSRGTQNPELDALIEAQASEYDPARRRDLFHQIQTLAFQDAYRFVPATFAPVWTWNPRIRDFHPNFSLFEYHHWARVWFGR